MQPGRQSWVAMNVFNLVNVLSQPTDGRFQIRVQLAHPLRATELHHSKELWPACIRPVSAYQTHLPDLPVGELLDLFATFVPVVCFQVDIVQDALKYFRREASSQDSEALSPLSPDFALTFARHTSHVQEGIKTVWEPSDILSDNQCWSTDYQIPG